MEEDDNISTFWCWGAITFVAVLAIFMYFQCKADIGQFDFATIKDSLARVELPWVYVTISFMGTILNMCGSKLGFVFWGIANSLWIFHFLQLGNMPQVVLFTGYLITSAIGFCIWAAKEDVKI